jgi:hypothetical protein
MELSFTSVEYTSVSDTSKMGGWLGGWEGQGAEFCSIIQQHNNDIQNTQTLEQQLLITTQPPLKCLYKYLQNVLLPRK